MCDHIDADGNCLGWESAGWHPIKGWLYNRKINKMVKKYKKLMKKNRCNLYMIVKCTVRGKAVPVTAEQRVNSL